MTFSSGNMDQSALVVDFGNLHVSSQFAQTTDHANTGDLYDKFTIRLKDLQVLMLIQSLPLMPQFASNISHIFYALNVFLSVS
jgi:hypothetical protein